METTSSLVEDLLKIYSSPSLTPKDGVVPVSFFASPMIFGTTCIFVIFG